MKEFYKRSFIPWLPVIIRGSLWVIISVLTELVHHIRGMTPEKLANMTWVNWTDVVLSAVLAGALALRLFLDGSVARHQDHMRNHPRLPERGA